jgi:hypothetical protein
MIFALTSSALDVEVDLGETFKKFETSTTNAKLPNLSSWFGESDGLDADALLEERMTALGDIEAAYSKPDLDSIKRDSKFIASTTSMDLNSVDENDITSKSIPDLSDFTSIPLMEIASQIHFNWRNHCSSKLDTVPEIQHEDGESGIDILELRENQLVNSMNDNARLHSTIQEKDAQIEELIAESGSFWVNF